MTTNNGLPFGGNAKWIWSAEGIANRPAGYTENYRVRFFRRSFDVPDGGAHLIVHLSADSRYVLWCNGALIERGPARGDISHHFYDTISLSDHLLPGGKNVLAGMVVYCGDVLPTFTTTGSPCGLMTGAPGFILDGSLLSAAADGGVIEVLSTDRRWTVCSDTGAYRHEHCEGFGTYTGFTERFYAAYYPWGWQLATFDDAAWSAATEICKGDRPDTVRDPYMPHRLIPRAIPFMQTRPEPFTQVISGPGGWSDLISGAAPLTIGPNASVSAILGVPAETTALPSVGWSGGASARIRLIYAEALSKNGVKQRGVDAAGDVEGVFDEIAADGGDGRNWQSWHYRTYRYVKVEITTGAEPLTVNSIDGTFWAYPYQMQASLEAEDPFYARLLEVGFRTIQLSSHEVFEDCPYYEQLSYAGDNYVEMRVAAALAGDMTLARNTIRLFNWSRDAEGLTKSRYPCRMPQLIPAWSQFWVLQTLWTYEYSGDPSLAAEVIDGIDAVNGWFERRREEGGQGLVGNLVYWCILDWSPDWQDEVDGGVPPGTYHEANAAHNMLHVWCLRAAAALHTAIGNAGESAGRAARADRLAERIHAEFWDESQGAYRERRGGREHCQLTNALSILSGVAPRALWRRIAPRLTDPSMMRAAYFGQYFVFEALAQAGEFDLYWQSLDVYRDIIGRQAMTTLPEDPVNQRSDCHGWSTGVCYHLLANGLGVKPGSPGFKSIIIEPQIGPLNRLSGVLPTPVGPVSVEVVRDGLRLRVRARTPEVRVVVRLPGEPERVFDGGVVEA